MPLAVRGERLNASKQKTFPPGKIFGLFEMKAKKKYSVATFPKRFDFYDNVY
jgi:hypothetical protein